MRVAWRAYPFDGCPALRLVEPDSPARMRVRHADPRLDWRSPCHIRTAPRRPCKRKGCAGPQFLATQFGREVALSEFIASLRYVQVVEWWRKRSR